MGEKRSQEQPTRIERLAKNKGTKGFTIPTHSDSLFISTSLLLFAMYAIIYDTALCKTRFNGLKTK